MSEDLSNEQLDQWICDLKEFNIISEQDVKRLCNKVFFHFYKLGKRNFNGRIKCTTSFMSCYNLW